MPELLSINKGDGRIEERTYDAIDDPHQLGMSQAWEDLRSCVGCR